MRRLALLCAALLAGCSGDTTDGPDPLALPGALTAALAGTGGGAAPAPPDPATLRAAITPEVAASLPVPTLFAVLGDSVSLPQRITVSNGVETWLTEDDITLSTRDGMVVATRGLGFDVMEADVELALAALRGGGARASRNFGWLDGEGRMLRRSFDCVYTRSGAGITERCHAIGLSFENAYILRGGRIVASRQWLGPVLGAISLEQLSF